MYICIKYNMQCRTFPEPTNCSPETVLKKQISGCVPLMIFTLKAHTIFEFTITSYFSILSSLQGKRSNEISPNVSFLPSGYKTMDAFVHADTLMGTEGALLVQLSFQICRIGGPLGCCSSNVGPTKEKHSFDFR